MNEHKISEDLSRKQVRETIQLDDNSL